MWKCDGNMVEFILILFVCAIFGIVREFILGREKEYDEEVEEIEDVEDEDTENDEETYDDEIIDKEYVFKFEDEIDRLASNSTILLLINEHRTLLEPTIKLFFKKNFDIGVSFVKFEKAVSKINNNDLEKITREEHISLNFYLAVLLYYLEDEKIKDSSLPVHDLILHNTTLKQLDEKYSEPPFEYSVIKYQKSAQWVFEFYFAVALEIGISPKQYINIKEPILYVHTENLIDFCDWSFLLKSHRTTEISKMLDPLTQSELKYIEYILNFGRKNCCKMPEDIKNKKDFRNSFDTLNDKRTVSLLLNDFQTVFLLSYFMVKYFEPHILKYGTTNDKVKLITAVHWVNYKSNLSPIAKVNKIISHFKKDN